MKIRLKLSILVIAIMALVAAGIATLLLREASNISLALNIQGISYLNDVQAEYWRGRQDRRLQLLRTLANVMSDYERIPAEERRDRFDDMLGAVLAENADFVNLYTVWKPNALDGMDQQFIGRMGSTPTGQYAMAYTRETGQIETRASFDAADATAYLLGPNAERERILQPFSRVVNGRNAYLLRFMVPIVNHRTGEIVGGVGCLFNIDALQEGLKNVMDQYEIIEAMAIYYNSGFIMASYAPERISRMLPDVDTLFGEHIQEANRAVMNGVEVQFRSRSETLNSNVQIDLMPFRVGNSDTTWTVMIAADEAYILSEVRALTRFTIIASLVVILIVAVLVFFVFDKVTKPIVAVADTLKDIAQGEGDLTRTIPVSSKDEVGDLSIYFNQTLDKIKNLVINIKNEALKLSEISNDLSNNMNKTATAVNEINVNIQNIKGQVINQSASVTETNATMDRVTENIDKLNEHVERQSGNVSQASSAIEEMVANIRSVTNTLVKNTANVNSLMEASEVGRTGLQDVAADIQEIARESEGLMEINSVMENIASQTNLLSMNAAIEAAHAGDAGKGFAVVADEIRKLAESSGEQSKTIVEVLKKIKDSIDNITRSTDNVLNKFEAIDSSVKTVAEQEENIRNAMEEQGTGSKQILNGIGELNDITRQVKSGSNEMFEGAKEVIKESDNLEKLTQDISSRMNEMASGADQINRAVKQVNEISSKNHEGINALIKEVSRFKVE